MLQEADQEFVFLWRQAQEGAVTVHTVFPLRYGEGAAAQLVAGIHPLGFVETAQNSPHSGNNLPQVEGLGDIIVSPGFQTVELVLHSPSGGEHDDGNPVTLGEHSADIHTADIRQHPV